VYKEIGPFFMAKLSFVKGPIQTASIAKLIPTSAHLFYVDARTVKFYH